MRRYPRLRAGPARRWISCPAQRHDRHHPQHAEQRSGKSGPLDLPATLDQGRREGVGFHHLAAPAAGADEVGDGDAVDQHHHQGRQHTREPVNSAPAQHSWIDLTVQIPEPQPQTSRGHQQRHRKRGRQGIESFHASVKLRCQVIHRGQSTPCSQPHCLGYRLGGW